ncbi:MAG: hypothetical protein GY948_07460 [Alphaproteobacteria bacterium]|nr:hypothetical protein [Alphaproteobacteria bacterium]
MKRLYAISFYVTLVMALAGTVAQSLANTRHVPMSSTRAYFVRAYAMVIAGETLAPQCKMLRPWQQQNLRRHANRLRALMAQRLPVEDVNQAKRIASELVDRHSNCGASARSIVDDSLFAAHGLVHSRAEGTEPQSLPPDLKEFLAWAKSEIETRKPKKPVVVAKAKKTKAKRPPSRKFKRYRASVEAYYLERHCKHLSRRAARSYWKLIARAHKKAVVSFGTAKVSAVQRRAERNSKRKARRCGSNTRSQVMAGYTSMQTKPKRQALRASLTLTSRSPEDFLGR